MEIKKIEAILIFEILGRPASHIKETLEKLVEVIGNEKGIKILKKQVHDARKVENKEKDENGKIIKVSKENQLFSTFAEVEVNAEDVFNLLLVMFKYMPAHVEVLYPENFNFSNIDFNSIFNEILAKLHNYDAIAKSAIMNNQILGQRLNEMMQKQTQNPQKQVTPLEISLGKKKGNEEEKTGELKIAKTKIKKIKKKE